MKHLGGWPSTTTGLVSDEEIKTERFRDLGTESAEKVYDKNNERIVLHTFAAGIQQDLAATTVNS